MYCLYYLDAQISICCNLRPLMTALELKYEREYLNHTHKHKAVQAVHVAQ